MDKQQFLRRVRALAPFESDTEAEAAIDATLAAVGSLLVSDERRHVLESLPPGLHAALQAGDGTPEMTLEQLYSAVARYEGVRSGYAREHALVVCRALTEVLSPETARLLRRHLPDHAELFSLPEQHFEPDRVDRAGHIESQQRTLAAGRPGGQRPLSESRPGSRHPVSESRPDRAHSHSVARNDDPHNDTRLSSTRGMTQEREGETLADGKPPGRS